MVLYVTMSYPSCAANVVHDEESSGPAGTPTREATIYILWRDIGAVLLWRVCVLGCVLLVYCVVLIRVGAVVCRNLGLCLSFWLFAACML